MASRKQGLLGMSEELIARISDLPYAKNLVEGLNTLRERVDDLQRRMRGLDELTKRVAALERRVDQLSGGSRRAPSSKSARARTTKSAGASTRKSSGTRSSGSRKQT